MVTCVQIQTNWMDVVANVTDKRIILPSFYRNSHTGNVKSIENFFKSFQYLKKILIRTTHTWHVFKFNLNWWLPMSQIRNSFCQVFIGKVIQGMLKVSKTFKWNSIYIFTICDWKPGNWKWIPIFFGVPGADGCLIYSPNM